MDGMMNLLKSMPQSESNMEAAKEGVIQKIRTERITKSKVLSQYESAQKKGIDFDSRFPPLNVANSSQVLSGKLRYSMVSYGFEMILKNDIFKLKIHIKDRELNTSNIIETPEFTLEEILVE